MPKIITELKKSNLKGRSGSGFPTGLKWEAVLKAVKKSADKKCFVICNAAEGEPAVSKDKYILENFSEEVINGMKIALKTLRAEKAYIYLRRGYYKKFKNKLEKLIGDLPIILFPEVGGYLCGEETTLLESIEGGRLEPRLRPPFPTERGFFGCPTLINNVETFYSVSKIAKGEYKKTRFYSVGGEVKHPGVYELPEDWSIGRILAASNNLPDFKFFVQVGGGASGGILIHEELDTPVSGTASIVVYNQRKTDPVKLMKKWVDFFYQENCGKCAPCREGVYRLKELMGKKKIDVLQMRAVLSVLKEASFCPLGKSVAFSVESLLERVELKL